VTDQVEGEKVLKLDVASTEVAVTIERRSSVEMSSLVSSEGRLQQRLFY
jgi:hypothetical protein